jgi:hypothetical protein
MKHVFIIACLGFLVACASKQVDPLLVPPEANEVPPATPDS